MGLYGDGAGGPRGRHRHFSTAYVKDPDDPAWKDDAGVKGWREFMAKYVPEADLHDTNYVNAYNSAMALEQC